MGEALEPARYSARFARFFAWYSRRLFGKRFAAVRAAKGSIEALRDADAHDGPVMLVMNHPSWWDPLLGLVVTERHMAGRTPHGVIELEQWRTFGFMRRLGVFGLDPEHPEAIGAMTRHVSGLFAEEARGVFAITPQGMFTDPRERVRARPGAAAVATAVPGVRVVALAVEYGFWNDQRPEAFTRVAPVERPEQGSTTGWHRAITRSMRANAEALAGLVMARDESAFEALLGEARSRINPVYDAWLRVRGRSPEIRARGTEGASR